MHVDLPFKDDKHGVPSNSDTLMWSILERIVAVVVSLWTHLGPTQPFVLYCPSCLLYFGWARHLREARKEMSEWGSVRGMLDVITWS